MTRFNLKLYLRKPVNGAVAQFSFEIRDFEIYGTNAWKVFMYLIIGFIYLAIGFLLYKHCTPRSQGLSGNNEYITVN